MCSCVECVSEHHIKQIDFPALDDLGNEDLGMLFEDVNIAEAILDKLRSDELT
jgi:hypothetical protein